MEGPSTGRNEPGSPTLSDAVRIQILATEHWSLLATRSMTWSELFARSGMFVTVLSASVVSLALMAQATGFSDTFRIFALLVLSVTLVLGVGTLIRLGDAMSEDVWLVMGMNRLRHAYLDTAPDLEPYFITSRYDDIAGIMSTRGPGSQIGPGRFLSATPTIVSIINSALAGVIVALGLTLVTGRMTVVFPAGMVAGLAAAFWCVGILPRREIRRFSESIRPRFPSGE
jgi:hypothetical protein